MYTSANYDQHFPPLPSKGATVQKVVAQPQPPGQPTDTEALKGIKPPETFSHTRLSQRAATASAGSSIQISKPFTGITAKSAEEAIRISYQLPGSYVFEGLSSGATSEVKKMSIGQQTFAVKISKVESGSLSERMQKLAFTMEKGEVCGLKISPHPHLVKTYAVLLYNEDNDQYYLINDPGQIPQGKAVEFWTRATIHDLAKGKELFFAMKDKDIRPCADLAINVGLQVCDALTHLHQHGFIYRDLKPENVIYDLVSGQIKLVDLGFVKPLDSKKTTRTFCGTPEYTAPEIINGAPYNYSVDAWTLGMFLYELATGKSAIEGVTDRDVYDAVLTYSSKGRSRRKRKFRRSAPGAFVGHEELLDIIADLTCKDPGQRLTVPESRAKLNNLKRRAYRAFRTVTV